MKRVVAIVIIMAMVTTLFAFSVYAAPTMGSSYTTYISSDDNNITAYAYAVYEEGVYDISSQGNQVSLPSLNISIRIVNNTDEWIIKDTDQFKLRINGNTAVSYPFEFIELVNCQIVATNTSSGIVDVTIKGNNSFILAPNQIYILSFRFVNSAGFTSTPSLQFFNNQFLNSAYTIDELVSLPADEIAYLESNNVLLSDLIDALTYSGNVPGYTIGSGNASYVNKTFSSDYSVSLHRFVSQPYLIFSDTVIDPSNDNIYQNASVRYDIKLIITETVTNSNLSISQSNVITGILPNGNYTNLVIDNMYTSSFDSYNLNSNRLTLWRKNRNIIPNRYVLNIGTYVSVINAHITLPYGTNITFDNMSLDLFATSYSRTNVYAPVSEYFILRDLYNSLVKPSDQDNTEAAQDMNDDIHDAEQVWYDNNSEALEQVGLSNYRFSTSQSNGITQAVTQFQAVWDALGDWTNVYIFILILSISTYIIRHEPTTRVKQYRSSVQAERAERISYYGRKNAESRANNSTTLKSVIRRRK